MAFIDTARIVARAGDGGAGVAAFEKRKGKPRGKPSGGSGGAGGDVVLEASPDVPSLLRFDRQLHWKAERGTHGEGENRHGKNGADLVIEVPLGTMVRDEEGTLLADLVEPGQQLRVARGGKGGRGNASFVSMERKAPSYAEQGEYGEERTLFLEMRLMADAALVGYPNAGKSTFISRVSAARPKIADYPFTTLEPNLGVVTVGDREFVLADIPGLIEGAAEGRGLGHEFLRHTERARVLIVLLDPSDLQIDWVDRQLAVLDRELRAHDRALAERPRLVLLAKADVVPDIRDYLAWAEEAGIEILPVSAVTGAGIDDAVHAIANLVDLAVREAPEREGFELHRPVRAGYTVTRTADAWLVEGRGAERAVNLDDLTVPEAANLVAKRLARIGVEDALRSAGAEAGDDVRIGDLVFTFDPQEEDDEAAG